MDPIAPERLAASLDALAGQRLYVHLETTAGAYTAGGFGAFSRNLVIVPERLMLRGTGPYRIGIRTAEGWLYAEGLTHAEIADGRVFMEGHDDEGRLTVILLLSREPLAVAGTARILPAGRPFVRPAGAAPPPTQETGVLVSSGHPDDETFGWGGTMALYSAAGVPLTQVTATLGEMGRNLGDPPRTSREDLRRVRETELRDACDALGVGDLWLLGIWDKTSEFRDPEDLAEGIGRAIEAARPSLILTSHPVHGGHPDHCSAGRATLLAVGRMPVASRPRVFCGMPSWVAEREGLTPNIVDISSVREVKIAAIRAHRSQSERMMRRFEAEQANLSPEMERRFSRESYIEIQPDAIS